MRLRGGHTPEAVANYFLDLAEEDGRTLTPMQLQKLVYIAHGWSLALNGKELVSSEPQAWQWGPVYPSLYDNTKRYGSGPVYERIRENNWAALESIRGKIIAESFSEEEKSIIEQVYDIYGDLEAFQLSALTHNPGTPWTEIYRPGKRRAAIPNELIKKHFNELAAD